MAKGKYSHQSKGAPIKNVGEDHYKSDHKQAALHKAYVEKMFGADGGGSRYSSKEVGHEEVYPGKEKDYIAPDHSKGSGAEHGNEVEHGSKEASGLKKKVAKKTHKHDGHTSEGLSVFKKEDQSYKSPFQKKVASYHNGKK